jgi:hypothetical protein
MRNSDPMGVPAELRGAAPPSTVNLPKRVEFRDTGHSPAHLAA